MSGATTWWPARRRLATAAIVVAVLTGVAGTILDGPGSSPFGAEAYVVISLAAILVPAAITAQVVAGQLLVGRLLLGSDGPGVLVLIPLVAGVILTAELLSVVARLDSSVERDAGDALMWAGRSSVLGALAFGIAALVVGLPGPTGLTAVVLASGACVGLAVVVARSGA